EHIEKNGKPSLVHVHVGMKAGLLMQWIKRRYAIPYLVTEHWTGFLPEAAERFDQLSLYLQKKWKELWQNAAGISVVSAYLGKHIRSLTMKMAAPKVIPNVVDTSLFFPLEEIPHKVSRFIHVSGLGFQKNPEA